VTEKTTGATTVPARGAGTSLDDRYGRTRATSRRNKVAAWAAGAAVALVFVVWVIWAGLDGTASAIEVRDTGYELTDSTATAEWQLTVNPGTETRCAVQALSESFEIVGWKVVDIPASDQRTRAFTETVRTTMPPTTGLIYRCWLP
jgi:hypothetical protein